MQLQSEMIRDLIFFKKLTLGGLISILKWTFVIKAKLYDLGFMYSLWIQMLLKEPGLW